LFAGEPFVIEAHVDSDQEVDLTSCLQNINGVLNVAKQNRLYRMGCSKDVTPDIARAIVQSGVGLTGLYKKEYGLDDIYNRYFEGGKKNG
jgi:ABC-2 type transport system ATP-binding protein